MRAQGPENVLVVANDDSAISRSVAEYYARRRAIPARNLCHIRASVHEDIDRAVYDREIAAPIGAFLNRNNLVQSIFYIVTTSGVPLRIEGTSGLGGNAASVDSELAALYFDLTQGKAHPVNGSLENPFFGKIDSPRQVHFVKPKLVAEIKFTEWTHESGEGGLKMRAPVFEGLRADKDPRECVFEVKKSTREAVTEAEGGTALRG